ncbi:MAG TPA: AAA family ATPase, partial [Variovorax sp.]|nr:AAA family ATPase [Variovorax sp.]
AQRFGDIDAQLDTLATAAEDLRARWQAQRTAAQALLEARGAFGAARREAVDAGADTASPALKALDDAVLQAERAFVEAQGREALVRIDVDPDVVAKVVSDWTGVPVGKMQRDQASTALGLADALKRRIRGQDAALDQVAEIVKTASSGLNDPRQPLGVFLLVGPSGVGKTETALAVADLLFGDEKSTVVVNMSEFQERHNVSRLIGSPPGYVGYGEGGLLTEAVRQRPYTVVLLDEVEKAHLDVLNLFYQVFDKGMLSDGEGKEIDFANTVIFLTSNLATDVITEMTRDGERPDAAVLAGAIRPLLSAHFKPALLARMTIVPYATLDAQALGGIVRLKLERIVQRLARNNKMRFSYAEAVVERIAARCTEVETGARNIDFILRGNVLPLMSQQILQRMGSGEPAAAVHLDVDAEGEFAVSFAGDASAWSGTPSP